MDCIRSARYLWAKKSSEDGVFKWLSLQQHLEDTRNITGLLWEHWLSSGQKLRILESLNYEEDYDGKRFAQFLAAVHDIGKATPVFQKQRSYAGSGDLDNFLMERLEGDGFYHLISHSFPNAKDSPHALAGQTLLRSFGIGDDITSIIGAHHGRPTNDQYFFETQQAFFSNYRQSENREDPIHKHWLKVQEELLNWALELSEFNAVEELPQVEQVGQVLLSGLMIMADWIASNEKFFPLRSVYDEGEVDQGERTASAWLAWYKTGAKEFTEIDNLDMIYRQRFGEGFAPRGPQRIFFETIEKCHDPGIFVFEAPMGNGKTEAALIGAEQLASRTGRSGIYFALPTQATSNSMFSRVNRWLENIDFGYDERSSIQLVHGKAALNQEFAQIPRGANINIDETSSGGGIGEATVVVNQWFSGRKTSILDDFVVGTVDQVLLAALKQKHLALRHLGLSRKAVIIDEVHAYDAYMSRYLARALAWLGGYHVPVILLSATLPSAHRVDLVKAYLKGQGLKDREMHSEGDLKTTAYPLVTYTDGNAIRQEKNFEPLPDVKVEVCPLEEEEFLKVTDKVMERGGNLGVIVNTVKRAQDWARKCIERYGSESVYLLHASFTATERVKKENDLLAMIGKGAKRPEKKIIIGTQVVEQSLDIDFDVLISDLAPMDLLIQRMGRLHRHPIDRPALWKEPKTYVLGLNEDLEFEKGSVAVYGGYLLARTQYYLPEVICIPGDISDLVQKVYGKDELILDQGLVGKYEKMEEDAEFKRKDKEGRASKLLLDEPSYTTRRSGSISLIKWLEQGHPNQSEEFGIAQVRDTEETIEVIALQQQGSGYSVVGESNDVSSHIERAEVAMKLASSTLRLPLVLSEPLSIDRTIEELEAYNLKNLKAWQDQSWLKGALGIIFDENQNFTLNGYILHYDVVYGLTYEEEGRNE